MMEITEENDISRIARSFGNAAEAYHQEAEIQKKVADGLISSLLPWRELLPSGPILEVGCGTGFLTRQLIEHFPDKEFLITDASPKMVEFCKSELEKEGLLSDKIQFQVLDADEFEEGDNTYAMVVSNFAPHWFKDTSVSLENLSKAIQPGGLLLCSFPGNHSFEQWYEHCLELGLPYTANPLPDVEEVVVKLSMGPIQIDYYENDLFQEFDSSIDFFRHLKRIGASVNVKGNALTSKQFRLLADHWDQKSNNKLKIKWHVVYLAAKKDYA
ncbi:methyltransferase domain-containing protein [Gracilimonas sediminicola]|uniref:methyltransferase domain-containing protein n=1 Tax=Gracilimonas sediminicola TaxID=2952158 RepID=UPI0038D4C890